MTIRSMYPIDFLFLYTLFNLHWCQPPPSNRAGTISCGESISGTINTFDDPPAYEFIMQSTPITFKTCNSIADTKLTHLYYENGNWESGFPWCNDQSNLPDGICNNCGIDGKHEEWTINFLNPQTIYYIEIDIWDLSGQYQIQMDCSSNTTTSIPTTSIPTTNQPTTSVPTTNQPTTSIPTTNQPTTSIPTTNQPTTSIPTILAPTTNQPSTAIPSSSVPTTVNPTITYNPTSHVPTSNAPTSNVPTTYGPISSGPTSYAPLNNVPTINIAITTSINMITSVQNDHEHEVVDIHTTEILYSEELDGLDHALQKKNGIFVMNMLFWFLIVISCLFVTVIIIFIVIFKKKRNKNNMNVVNEMVKIDSISPTMTAQTTQTMNDLTPYHIHSTPITHNVPSNINIAK
eukprot:19596_1